MKTIKMWISRDRDDMCFTVNIWDNREPILHHGRWESSYSEDLREMHSPQSFKEKYGFTPRKGSCKRYNLTLEEIK